MTIVLHVLILWTLVVVALAVAFLIERRRNKDDDNRPEYQVAMTFVASSYGLLLGLLVGFGVTHYTDVRKQAQEEADALLAVWDTLAVYPTQARDPARRDLLCYMRSIREDDWPSMQDGNRLESERAQAFGDHLRVTLRALPQDRPAEGSAYGRVQSTVAEGDKARQQLLFATESAVPPMLWAVIYVGAFLLFLLIATHYACRPAGRLISLGSVVTLLTVVVAVLSMLDQPYGPGVRVGPSGLTHAIDLLTEGGAARDLAAPCPVRPA